MAAATHGTAPSQAPLARKPAGSSDGALTGGAAGTTSGNAAMQDRMPLLMMALVGSTVVVRTSTEDKYVGVLSSVTTASDELAVSLSQAVQLLSGGTASVLETIAFPARDVAELHALDVKLASGVQDHRVRGGSDFQTDVQISGTRAGDGPGRSLQKWSGGDDSLAGGIVDIASPARGSANGGWDQFAANEARFGIKSNYNEELYTTKLNRSGANFAAKEREAERIAAEILAQTTTDAHVAEERGLVVDSGEDEEDKYSGVQRGPNAYVPPGARRGNAAGPAAATLVAVSQAAIARSGAEGGRALPPANAPKKDKALVYDEFNRFVQKEQSQAHAALQQQQLKKEKDLRLAELKKWGTTFKLKSSMPEDIASMSAKKPAANADGSSNGAASSAPNAAQPSEEQAGSQDPKYTISKMTLPKIPPFNPEKAKTSTASASGSAATSAAVTPAITAAAPAQGVAPSQSAAPSSGTKLRAGASAFKPFNPGAAVFKPGQPSAAPTPPASIVNAAQTPRAEDRTANSKPPNPFFGHKDLKRPSNGAPINVFSDFSPLRAQRRHEPPSATSAWWPYQGRDFRSIFAPAAAISTPLVSFLAGGDKSPIPAPARAVPAVQMQGMPYLMNGVMGQAPYGYAYPAGMPPQRLPQQPHRPLGPQHMGAVPIPGPYFAQAPFSPPLAPPGAGPYNPQHLSPSMGGFVMPGLPPHGPGPQPRLSLSQSPQNELGMQAPAMNPGGQGAMSHSSRPRAPVSEAST